jgi:hypothetical protein
VDALLQEDQHGQGGVVIVATPPAPEPYQAATARCARSDCSGRQPPERG